MKQSSGGYLNQDQLLTVEEAASMAAVHEETVRRAYLAGHLNVLRIGRSVRVSLTALQHWLENGGQTRAA